jgi:hypothetical protein
MRQQAPAALSRRTFLSAFAPASIATIALLASNAGFFRAVYLQVDRGVALLTRLLDILWVTGRPVVWLVMVSHVIASSSLEEARLPLPVEQNPAWKFLAPDEWHGALLRFWTLPSLQHDDRDDLPLVARKWRVLSYG